MKKILLLIILLTMIMFLPACNGGNEQVDIYASIYPVYYITEYIVKDKLVSIQY